MGADIHTWATDDAGEIINDRGEWHEWIDGKRNSEPFSDRHYRLFGWLGDVRNYLTLTMTKSLKIGAARGRLQVDSFLGAGHVSRGKEIK